MEDYAADYKARTGDDVTYGGRYQNTGIFLLKYLDVRVAMMVWWLMPTSVGTTTSVFIAILKPC